MDMLFRVIVLYRDVSPIYQRSCGIKKDTGDLEIKKQEQHKVDRG